MPLLKETIITQRAKRTTTSLFLPIDLRHRPPIGISFYVESGTSGFNVDVSWGDYVKSTDKTVNKDGKEINVNTYTRHPQKETIAIELDSFSKSQEYPLVCDSNVVLYISKIGLRQGYTLVTAYVINRRKNSESDIAGLNVSGQAA